MNKAEIESIVTQQRTFFRTNATLPIEFRINALKKLKSIIQNNKDQICQALKSDLGKSDFESYMCEIGLTLTEITHMLKHVKKYSKPQKVPTPLAQFKSTSYRKPSPRGVCLIMSPWNYPFLLTIDPLVTAIATGNTAIVKPSAYSPATSTLIQKLIDDCFEPEYIKVINGGREENTALLDSEFDFIFFTGSQNVGKIVMEKASKFLTPVVLELGGKSPCIVEKSANIKLAARRIVFGKFLNCGQTCVAPDYIYCDSAIKDELVAALKAEVITQFGQTPLTNKDYGKIINEKHFNRVAGLIQKDKIVIGGNTNAEQLKIEPTIMADVSLTDPVMQEEIFGPVLPIVTYDTLDQAITEINNRQHPLAFYIFTTNQKIADKVLSSCGFGGGCINDTIIHLATTQMPFGGFRESGMGHYHGEEGFKTFSHYKSIVDKKNWLDLPMRYQPYTKTNQKLLEKFLR